jgi:hypothetical protein
MCSRSTNFPYKYPDATVQENKNNTMYSTGDVKAGISEYNNKSPVGILASLRVKWICKWLSNKNSLHRFQSATKGHEQIDRQFSLENENLITYEIGNEMKLRIFTPLNKNRIDGSRKGTKYKDTL